MFCRCVGHKSIQKCWDLHYFTKQDKNRNFDKFFDEYQKFVVRISGINIYATKSFGFFYCLQKETVKGIKIPTTKIYFELKTCRMHFK